VVSSRIWVHWVYEPNLEMLSSPIIGNMPFWDESGLIYCVDAGEVDYSYSDYHTKLRKSIIKRHDGDEYKLPLDIVRNPFLKKGVLHFSGCSVRNGEPIVFDNFKVKSGSINKLRRDSFGSVSIMGNKFSHNDVVRSFPDGTTILRVIPCYDQFLIRYKPLIFTVFDGSFVKSFLYKRSDSSLFRITNGEDDSIFPTIYDGVMIHVIEKDGSTIIKLDKPRFIL